METVSFFSVLGAVSSGAKVSYHFWCRVSYKLRKFWVGLCFQGFQEKFKKAGAQVVGIGSNDPSSHKSQGRNAVPLVEPGCLLGDCHFFGCLFNHILNTRELEFLIYQTS
ncbi:hypothetical protein CFP56_004986 [Quercus suber]|uniref:Uncharacterized protein n=1 Tax=Quercus suber TaxID=58331 RepID=A0AAW0LBE1_QUESU